MSTLWTPGGEHSVSPEESPPEDHADADLSPVACVFALHIYHMLPDGFRLHPVDYLHHIVMIFLGIPLLLP